MPEAELQNTRVTAFPGAKSLHQCRKKFFGCGFVPKRAKGKSPGRKRSLFGKGNQFVGQWSKFARLGKRGFDAIPCNKGGEHISKERLPVGCRTSEFSMCNIVSHILFYLFWSEFFRILHTKTVQFHAQ